MFAFLAPLAAKLGIKGLMIIAVIGVVLGALGYMKVQSHRISVLKTEMETAKAVYAANEAKYKDTIAINAASLETLQASAAKNDEILERMHQSAEVTVVSVAKVKKDIRHAPPSDDGPVAPVLLRSLGWMPDGRQAPGSPGPAPSDPGKAADGTPRVRVSP